MATRRTETNSDQDVYYEDLISPPTKPERPATGLQVKETEVDPAVASASTTASNQQGPNPLKRQRTLMDMLGDSSTKRTKVDGATSAVVLKSQTLNTIPFNLNDFMNSLTEEQRDLLGLEIQTMGKSWSVSISPSSPGTSFPYRIRPSYPNKSSPTAVNLPHTAQA